MTQTIERTIGNHIDSYLPELQCFQLSDIINLVWACRKELSHQTL